MQLKTPINKHTLRHHLQYNAWKYAVLVVVSIFLWDIIYTTTAYRPPQDKRVDIYIQSSTADSARVDTVLEEIRAQALPELEVINTAFLFGGGGQADMVTAQQLMTYIMAQEGDLYFLRSEDYKQYAAQGVFLDLEPLISQGRLDAHDIDLTSGYVATQQYDESAQQMVTTSTRHLYGIPAATLPGFASELNIDHRDLFLAVTVYNDNDENVLRFLDKLIARMRTTDSKEVP